MADYLGKKIKFNIEDNDLQKIRFNKAYGESQQATRSGKNFLENTGVSNTSNGVTFTINDDKTILVDGNNDGTANSRFIINNYSLKAGTYILNGCPSGGSSTTYRLAIQKTSDWSILGLDTGSGSEQFTIDEATNIQVAIFIQKGQTISNLLFKPMIRLSSIIDDTYEQYGVSPSPHYPSEIESVKGKNLFDKDNANIINTYLVGSGNGVLPSDGGTENNCIYIPCKTNTTYTIQKMIGKRFGVAYTYNLPAQGVTAYNKTVDNTATNITITTDSSANYLVVYLRNGNVNGEITLQQALDSLQIEKGTVATPYVPYNSLEFKDEGKNLVKQMNWKQLPSISTGATVTTVSGYGTDFIEVDNTKNYVFSYSGTASSRYIVYYDKNKNFLGYYTNLQTNNFAKWSETGYVRLRVDCPQDSVTAFQLEEGTVATDYEPYKSKVATFPLAEGQKLYKGSYLADDGIHHRRKQVVFDGSDDETWTQNGSNQGYGIEISDVGGGDSHTVNKVLCDKLTPVTQAQIFTGVVENAVASIGGTAHKLYVRFDSSITTVALLREKLAESPILIEYELAEEEIVPYTAEQQEAWEKLRHFKGLNGENNITAQGTMTSTLDLTLYNVAEEDFDIYISKKGYFGALKYDINNLIDFMESNIPSIAEATESSVKIAGRDGDISLNTVYEPLPFEIVCYTEDNLTPEEKIIEEQKITSLLNSIKNQTKTFFMEREKKFYKVKYSGNLSVVRYPKHLKFTIPLKSSESYAMNFEESEIIGNGTKVSNTIKDTGAIFTIKGPAIKPIISLNNYQMKYNENILEGNSLIINSEDSTITHITSAGVKTNAMRAYNHEFPKIKNGENQLAVSSGIDDENQVNVKWYDLKI